MRITTALSQQCGTNISGGHFELWLTSDVGSILLYVTVDLNDSLNNCHYLSSGNNDLRCIVREQSSPRNPHSGMSGGGLV